MTTGSRVKKCRLALKISQSELARRARLTQPTISSLESDNSNTSGSLASIAQALGVSALWLETGLGPKEIQGTLPYTNSTHAPVVHAIPLLESKGSCGNGRHHFGELYDYTRPIEVSERLISKYHVKPAKLIALYADGDSMTSFIVDGDIMIFNTEQDGLQSGAIYLLDTPDGLRVKRIHRRVDGQVILSSDNPDKTRYPDEPYTQDQAALLTITAKFVFRIGG